MYSKIMIWANVTKFGQNFIAPPKFFGLVRLCLKLLARSSWCADATVLRTATLALIHFTAEYTARLFGVAVLILALSTTKQCLPHSDRMHASPHQPTIFLSYQASNQLSFVAKSRTLFSSSPGAKTPPTQKGSCLTWYTAAAT